MNKASRLTEGVAYAALLAGLVLALILAIRAVSEQDLVPAATAPVESPRPAPQETAAPPATLPAETPTAPVPTDWPLGFTPSPTLTLTATPFGTPAVITDPINHFSLTLFPGWYASTPSANAHGGATIITNYEDRNNRPPGGLSIQMSAGQLEFAQTFEQWLSDWIALSTSPEAGAFGVTVTEPQPYTLGSYEGISFVLTDPEGNETFEIDLPYYDRVIIIGLWPMDSPALSEALSMLAALEILPS